MVTKKVIVNMVLLIILAIIGLLVYYGVIILWSQHDSADLPTGWYIDPPNDYFYLKDKKQNQVVQWLQGIPYETSLLDYRSPSPYTFADWVEKGYRINDLEETLLVLYDSQYRTLLAYGLTKALKEFGTQKSISYFLNKLQKEMLSEDIKINIYDILYGIVRDQKKFSDLLKSTEDQEGGKLRDQGLVPTDPTIEETGHD